MPNININCIVSGGMWRLFRSVVYYVFYYYVQCLLRDVLKGGPRGGEDGVLEMYIYLKSPHICNMYICCGSIFSLLQIVFSFFSNSLSCYYHTLPYPKTKEKKI